MIWLSNLENNYAATRVVSLNPPGRDSVAVSPGIFNFQAQPPNAIPALVEDGQIVLLFPVKYSLRDSSVSAGRIFSLL